METGFHFGITKVLKDDETLTVGGYPQLKNNGRMSVEASQNLLVLRYEN
jgi:hypothetical protein